MRAPAQPGEGLRPLPAVGVACFRDEQVLLIRRGTPPKQGEWSLPGGRVEPGEPVREAALRELKEETAVDAQLIDLIDVVDAIFENRDGTLITRHYVLIDFLATWRSGEPQAGDDAADAQFFHLSELTSLEMWDETLRVINAAADRLGFERESMK